MQALPILVRSARQRNIMTYKEVSGQARKDKAVKVSTAQTLWVPAINNQGGFGRWAFLEVTDPWDVKNIIRKFIKDSYFPTKRESR